MIIYQKKTSALAQNFSRIAVIVELDGTTVVQIMDRKNTSQYPKERAFNSLVHFYANRRHKSVFHSKPHVFSGDSVEELSLKRTSYRKIAFGKNAFDFCISTSWPLMVTYSGN